MTLTSDMRAEFLHLLTSDVERPIDFSQVVPSKVEVKAPKNTKKTTDMKVALLVPDTQFGFRIDENGVADPFHDERALDVYSQIMQYVQGTYGIDQIVNLGDTIDMPSVSKHLQETAFQNAFQASLQAGYLFLAEQRAVAPNAEIVFLEGNHDCRLYKYLLNNAPQAAMLKRAGDIDRWPVNSLPHLLRMDELKVNYASGYPAGEHRIVGDLIAKHGDIAKSNGSTASQHLNKNHTISTVFGHTHRMEIAYHTSHHPDEPKRSVAFSPGCLCRVDGAVPSVKGGTTPNEKAVRYWENWQQGLGVCFYTEDGRFDIKPIHILDGWAFFEGIEFRASK